MSDRTRRMAYLAWLAVCLIWGTTYLGIRIALETVPPALVGGIRYTIAGALLAALLAARDRQAIPARRYWGGLALLGFLMICLGNGGVIWAEQWVPSGIAAVVIASSPFWMTGLEALLPGGERLSRRVLVGLSVGFTGILLLVWPDLMKGGALDRQFGFGLIALQVACIGWALGSAYSKRHARSENALGAAALQMLFGGLMMLAIAFARGEWAMLSWTPRTIAAEAYLTLFGSLLAYSAYVYALKYLPVSTVSLYAYANPVIAVLLGAALLDEPLGVRVILASLLVLLGVGVVRIRGKGEGEKGKVLSQSPGLRSATRA
jgi:drug/metabolite transporter (DMT)-like permease